MEGLDGSCDEMDADDVVLEGGVHVGETGPSCLRRQEGLQESQHCHRQTTNRQMRSPAVEMELVPGYPYLLVPLQTRSALSMEPGNSVRRLGFDRYPLVARGEQD